MEAQQLKRTIRFPPLHAAQRQLVESPARFRVACCGRRWGKGFASALIELSVALRGGQVWHISPDFPQSQEHWSLIRRLAQQIPGVTVRESEFKVLPAAGGYLQIRTANQTLRGSGLDHVTIDECASIADMQIIWQEALRPTLADRHGRALFTGTPKGLDYFHDLFGYGLDPEQPEWASFNFPTSTNPTIDPAEIEAARQSLPDRVFRQEWLAEFIADGSGVFRFVSDVSIAERQPAPTVGHHYYAGIDFGRSHDFTTISVVDSTARRQVWTDRFTGVSWEQTRQRIKLMYSRWRPDAIWCEGNSFGSPNIEQLQKDGLPAREFTTTAQSKAEIIDALALAIEKGAIGEDGGVILLHEPVQIGELQSYTYERLPSGTYRYTAPSGKHDDTVIALALSWYGVKLGDNKLHFAPNPFFPNIRYIAQDHRIARPITISSADISAATIVEGYKWEPDVTQKRIAVDIEDGDHVLMPNLLINRKSTPLVCCPRCYAWVAQLFIDQRRQLVCQTCLEELEPKVDVNQPNKDKEGITQ